MAIVKAKDLSLLTDDDVEYSHFNCCGDEDLVFLRCPACGHIWVECFECSTWYVDLNDLERTESCFLSKVEERPNCPRCEKPFDDFYYLMEGYVEKYLPTARDVVDAGFSKYLAVHLRDRYGNEECAKSDQEC